MLFLDRRGPGLVGGSPRECTWQRAWSMDCSLLCTSTPAKNNWNSERTTFQIWPPPESISMKFQVWFLSLPNTQGKGMTFLWHQIFLLPCMLHRPHTYNQAVTEKWVYLMLNWYYCHCVLACTLLEKVALLRKGSGEMRIVRCCLPTLFVHII